MMASTYLGTNASTLTVLALLLFKFLSGKTEHSFCCIAVLLLHGSYFSLRERYTLRLNLVLHGFHNLFNRIASYLMRQSIETRYLKYT